MGLSADALAAGYTPKTKPTNVETPTANAAELAVMTAGAPTMIPPTLPIRAPSPIPRIPPDTVSKQLPG
jgi:hypothetical protein